MREIIVGTSSVAELFGVTSRTVQKLVKDGIITAKHEGDKYKYNLLEAASEYIDYLRDRANGRNLDNQGMEELSKEKLKAETELKQAQAAKAQMELQELENILHRAEDVESATNDLIYYIRSAWLTLPGQMAVELAELNDPAEISEHLERFAFDTLEQLSQYKYNPKEYAKKVRERQGWQVHEDDD